MKYRTGFHLLETLESWLEIDWMMPVIESAKSTIKLSHFVSISAKMNEMLKTDN